MPRGGRFIAKAGWLKGGIFGATSSLGFSHPARTNIGPGDVDLPVTVAGRAAIAGEHGRSTLRTGEARAGQGERDEATAAGDFHGEAVAATANTSTSKEPGTMVGRGLGLAAVGAGAGSRRAPER